MIVNFQSIRRPAKGLEKAQKAAYQEEKAAISA
jgi:hypothetical protein